MKEIEKEEEEKGANADEPEKCEDEAEGSPDKEKKEDKGGKEEGASIDSPLRLCEPLTFQHPDSPTNIDAAIQNSLQVVVKTEQRKTSESSQELDVGLQLGDTGQVTEYHLELRGWMGLCNQLNHYVPGLAGEQAEFRKLLKKNVTFTVTERMMEEFEAAKKAMGKNILLNAFDVTRRTLDITDASAEGFRHILKQKRNEDEVMVKAQRGNKKGVITMTRAGWSYRWAQRHLCWRCATIVRLSSRLRVLCGVWRP